jgi:hypothetical protein
MSSAVRWFVSFLLSVGFVSVVLAPYFLPKYGAMIYSGSMVFVSCLVLTWVIRTTFLKDEKA